MFPPGSMIEDVHNNVEGKEMIMISSNQRNWAEGFIGKTMKTRLGEEFVITEYKIASKGKGVWFSGIAVSDLTSSDKREAYRRFPFLRSRKG